MEGGALRVWSPVWGARKASNEEGDTSMNQRGRFRLSTMEIALIGTLLTMLVLALLQARHDERRGSGEH